MINVDGHPMRGAATGAARSGGNEDRPLRGPRIPEEAAAVVIGWDTSFGRDRLRAAAQALRAGADLLVTSDARRLASRNGAIAGVGGFTAQGLSYVGERGYEVVGKPVGGGHGGRDPAPGRERHRMLVAGDDLTLEVRMARTAGAVAVLVTTGLHGRQHAAAAPPGNAPNLILEQCARHDDVLISLRIGRCLVDSVLYGHLCNVVCSAA